MKSTSFIILDKPETMDKIHLHIKYQSGKILLYILKNKNKYVIYAESDYYEDAKESDFNDDIDQLLCDDKIPYHTKVLILPPYSSEMLEKEPVYVSVEHFYTDFFNKFIKENYEIIKSIENASRNRIYILYDDFSSSTGVIIYYGICYCDLPYPSFKELGKTVNFMSVDDYFSYRDDYRIDNSLTDDEDENDSHKPLIIKRIRKWLEENSYKQFEDYLTGRVKGQEEVRIVAANFYNYFQRLADGKEINNNIMLIAPSGCGKTETFRAIRDYFSDRISDFPVIQVDLTTMTEQGFKGPDSDLLYKELLKHKETNGIGLVFMDEFDKKILPSFSSHNIDVNKAVQHQILTIIEGIKVSEKGYEIDTSNTLFIAAGAFAFCREDKTTVSRMAGFGEEFPNDVVDHYDKISRQDIIKAGGIYELVGRFSMIVNYHKLTEATIDLIIDSNISELKDSFYMNFEISENARQQLHSYANTEYGCRLIKSKLQEAIIPYYLDMICNKTAQDEDSTIIIDNIDNEV